MKTILIFLLLIIALTTKSQIKFKAELNTGWTNWSYSMFEDDDQLRFHSSPDALSFYSDIKVKAKWKGFEAKTSILTLMDNDGSYTFKPRLTEYVIGLYYNYKWLNFGIEHSCTHPVFTIPADTKLMYRASYDRVYIGIKISNYD